jgi:UDP-N-acetylglucosamine diphosphorylase/glucosamine-1-phosphate N-acetyltransferase
MKNYYKTIITNNLVLFDEDISNYEEIMPWELIHQIPDFFKKKVSDYNNINNVIFDERSGPIIIDPSATIEPFSVLRGPLYIGKYCLVKSHSNIANSIINRNCKVAGEVHSSIFQPFSNKAHEGFMGHSLIGSWVNLGAGTTTSNLKNNYSKISVKWGESLIKTDAQFLGSIIGDFSKTSIGCNLNTGTIIELGCNVVSQTFPPRHIKMFSMFYKDKIHRISFEDFCDSLERMMERRSLKLPEAQKNNLNELYKNIDSHLN